ncbi:hypothetical protein TNCV_4031321 [Trichonephila clavipes]|nr:hypothetical protein TNCV_4031321 [Trichonephila clavipes]
MGSCYEFEPSTAEAPAVSSEQLHVKYVVVQTPPLLGVEIRRGCQRSDVVLVTSLQNYDARRHSPHVAL